MQHKVVPQSVEEMQVHALEARRTLIRIGARSNSVHIGSSLSQIDILTVLYGSFLRITPDTLKRPDRDRFILSKGHAALGYYAVLSEYGFIPLKELEQYSEDGTALAGHPVLGSSPAIETTSGSLGHGLPMALGMAIAGSRNKWNARYVVLLSDGECDEGSNWEAIMFAGHLGLENLLVVVDYNKIQSFGTVSEVLELEPFADKWRANRWEVVEVDGHNIRELQSTLQQVPIQPGKPMVVIAHTVKGKGYPAYENTLESHYHSIKPDALEEVLKAIY